MKKDQIMRKFDENLSHDGHALLELLVTLDVRYHSSDTASY